MSPSMPNNQAKLSTCSPDTSTSTKETGNGLHRDDDDPDNSQPTKSVHDLISPTGGVNES